MIYTLNVDSVCDPFIRPKEVLYGSARRILQTQWDGEENIRRNYRAGIGFWGNELMVWKK